jgi:conjugal transfer pilus assembly protein TraW
MVFSRLNLGVYACVRMVLVACSLVASSVPISLHAEDFGTHGPVWEIEEPSLLDVIKSRLQEMEEAGDLSRMQQEMQDTTRAYVARPRPVVGLIKAIEERVFEIDLSITVSRDLVDHEGRVFAAAGTVINPLEYSFFNKRIVFLDGDDPAQVAFALSEGNELDTLLVLTNGAPLDLMREHGRRFYFDQDAVMVTRFQIGALPSEVTRGDRVMVVHEIPVGGGE